MVDVVQEPIDDEEAEMHIWSTADFYDFGLECGLYATHTLDF